MEIIAVSLPLPYSLKQITAYIVQKGDSLSIIDTGLHTMETSNTWKQIFAERNWSFKQVKQILLTHYHPDHYGFAGILQRWTEAEVFISKQEHQQIQSFWDRDRGNPAQVATFFQKYGFPKELLPSITLHMKGFRQVMEPHPEVNFFRAGETIPIGGEIFHILHTPGHSEGHLSFWQPKQGVIFAGDVLLPKITPNIPLLPSSDPNPLQTFFHTLQKLKELPIRTVYPAHGNSFTQYQERIGQIMDHHEQRLARILQFMKYKGKVNGYEVCQELFRGKNLDTHNLRFAFSETLAHLMYLHLSGKVHQEERSGIFYYFME